MRFPNDDLKCIHFPDEHDREADQHRDSLGETTAEKDKLTYLVQTGRELAHQLNNLLTTILANTQLTFLMVEDEELKTYLASVEDATRDAATVVREFQGLIRALAEPPSQENVLDGIPQPDE